MIKALILDGDGVAILPHEYFSVKFARERGFDVSRLGPFFDSEFQRALVGKANILELIELHRDLWGWHDTPEKLLEKWCESENAPNLEVVAATKELRERGLPVFMATNQEHYRAEFVRNEMFPAVFTDILASCDVGAVKPSTEFFRAAMGAVGRTVLGISTSEVAYFDDELKNVEAAQSFGLKAFLYTGVNQIRQLADQRDL